MTHAGGSERHMPGTVLSPVCLALFVSSSFRAFVIVFLFPVPNFRAWAVESSFAGFAFQESAVLSDHSRIDCVKQIDKKSRRYLRILENADIL